MPAACSTNIAVRPIKRKVAPYGITPAWCELNCYSLNLSSLAYKRSLMVFPAWPEVLCWAYRTLLGAHARPNFGMEATLTVVLCCLYSKCHRRGMVWVSARHMLLCLLRCHSADKSCLGGEPGRGGHCRFAARRHWAWWNLVWCWE